MVRYQWIDPRHRGSTDRVGNRSFMRKAVNRWKRIDDRSQPDADLLANCLRKIGVRGKSEDRSEDRGQKIGKIGVRHRFFEPAPPQSDLRCRPILLSEEDPQIQPYPSRRVLNAPGADGTC